MKRFPLVGSLVVVSLLGMAVTAHAQITGQVYEITLTGTVVGEEEVVPPDEYKVLKEKFVTEDVINLARGRDPGSPVAPEEKLALVFFFIGDEPDVQLIVYNSTTHSKLATLSLLEDLSGAFDSAKGKGYVNMTGGLNAVGNINGGWLAVTAKAVIDESNPALTILKMKASAVQGTIRGQEGLEEYIVLIAKGKLRLIGYIGSLLASPS